jgi:general secretion pathway protein H
MDGCRDKKRSGFTLLELIVVLVLIALIMGISAFFVTGRLGESRFDSFVRDMTMTLRQARELARKRGEPAAVIIDFDARIYGLADRKQRQVPDGIGIEVVDPFSREITRGKYQIVYQPDGVPDEGSIIIWTAKKKTQIRTDPVTGFELKKG